MKWIYRLLPIVLLSAGVMALSACRKDDPQSDDPPTDNGILNFINPAEGREISPSGETVSCVLMAEESYVAELVVKSGGDDWVALTKGQTGEAGRNTVRLVFETNADPDAREADLFIRVDGYERVCVATFVQSKDRQTAVIEKNKALNEYMHQRLQKEYLWDQYNGLTVDLEMDYTQFLSTHLLKLGDINVEDGGTYRAGSPDRGKRFIYSNIQEVAPLTKVYETAGLGFGPIFSSQIDAQGTIGLSIAYVHQGSPAWNAGIRRGDTIFRVNGVVLNANNYQSYMTALYYSPSGSYEFGLIRDADITKKLQVSVSVDIYRYNSVLYSGVIEEGEHRIGYLVLENFDLDAQDFVVDILQQLKDKNINELILDLRFNPGGAVAQSRYLASAIAGTKHLDDVFVNVNFRGNRSQSWKFRGGPNDEDGLGIAPDLGLSRLYVIGSENTASASELIINGLRGIDFPVILVGSRTEGKNVGMTTTQTTYLNTKYLFSPITFRVSNAKGFGDYPDGIMPDDGFVVNNQNGSYSDDIDNVFPYSFGDWGDMRFNKALHLAYQDIVGSSAQQASVRALSLNEFVPVPLGDTGLKQPVHGRYGNVIYLGEE